MKKHFILAAMAATTLFTACSNEEEEPLLQSEKQVTFTIAGVNTRSQTTAGQDGSISTAFVANDVINIYSDGLVTNMAGAEYTVSSEGTLTAPEDADKYVYNGDNAANFYAYYSGEGTASHADGVVTFTYNKEKDMDANDFMTASETNVIPSENAVALTFSHRLSLVRVAVTGITPTKVTISNAYPTVTWTMNTDEVATDETAEKIAIDAESQTVGSATEWWALIPAQTFSSGIEFISIYDGTDTYTFKPTADVVLSAGKMKKFNLGVAGDETNTKALIALSTDTDIEEWGTETEEEGTIEKYEKNYITSLPISALEITNRSELTSASPWGIYKSKVASGTLPSVAVSDETITVTTTSSWSSWYDNALYYLSDEKLEIGTYTLSFKAKTSSATKQIRYSLLGKTSVGGANTDFYQIIDGNSNYTNKTQNITTNETEYSFTFNTQYYVNGSSTGTSAVATFTEATTPLTGFYIVIGFQEETFTISDLKLTKN